jgi:hypothetical protein
MTAKEYRAFLKRHHLRQVDGGWLCDYNRRQSINWAQKGLRGAPALLLQAFDDGLIPIEWFAANGKRPIPGR